MKIVTVFTFAAALLAWGSICAHAVDQVRVATLSVEDVTSENELQNPNIDNFKGVFESEFNSVCGRGRVEQFRYNLAGFVEPRTPSVIWVNVKLYLKHKPTGKLVYAMTTDTGMSGPDGSLVGGGHDLRFDLVDESDFHGAMKSLFEYAAHGTCGG